MNEFMIDMQSKFQRAREEWTHRLEEHTMSNFMGFKQSWHPPHHPPHHSHSSGNYNTSSESVFRVLLQLFAHETDVEIQLDKLFEMDDGVTLTFYVPQLLSFLLHGALYSSPRLETWILNKCTQSVYFAHRCYWFLRAWCLVLPASPPPNIPQRRRIASFNNMHHNTTTIGNPQLSSQKKNLSNLSLNSSNQNPIHNCTHMNNRVGLFLDEPAVTAIEDEYDDDDGDGDDDGGDDTNHSVSSSSFCRPKTATAGSAAGIATDSATTTKPPPPLNHHPQNNNKFFWPEERAMIERLLFNIKECGQVHAAQWQQQWNQTRRRQQQVSETSSSLSSEVMLLLSPADIMELAEAGKIPVDENNGYPNLRHVEVLTGTSCHGGGGSGSLMEEGNNMFDANPMHMMNVTSSSSSPEIQHHHLSETEQFDKTPQFLDALLFVAENLQFVPTDQRKSILRTHLNRIECELLPSPLVYIPIGGGSSSYYQNHHWVWRIVTDESFPISTKERVPCIIVLEIIVEQQIHTNNNAKQCQPQSPPQQLRRFVGLGSNDNGNRYNNNNNNHVTGNHDNGNYQQASLPEEKVDHRMDSQPSSYSSSLHSWWDMSEAEQLELWRFGHRDPFRRISLLDKVTSTVKQASDKIQMNLRGSSVDQLPLFRNHHNENLEELQALTSPQTMMIPDQPQRNGPINRRGGAGGSGSRATSLSDAEHKSHQGPAFGSNGLPSSSRSVSRTSSGGSMVSLGQWTTPPIVKKLKDKDIENLFWKDRNETDGDVDRASPLTYGSDQEDESMSERGVANTFCRPPRAQHSKNPKNEMKTAQSAKSKRPPPVVFRESWDAKQERIRKKSAFGTHPGWRLVPILIKANDDLRQEQLASQIIQRMASILARENVPVWLCPYEIIALTDRGGIIEAIPDTISLDSLKKNDPHYTGLRDFFHSHFGEGTEDLMAAKANFVESLAAYSMVCFLLQIKDRHNGNILLDKWGHLIHIDFGFFFLSSPGKNAGFESAPFKLTRDFVEVLDGTDSHLFRIFRDLCVKTFITLRRRCMEIILLVEMLKNGNEELQCFRGRPDDAIQQLRDRFRLDLNDRACREYVNSLVDASIENWRTDWYDRYQRYFVGVL
jgi:phosphatidylinositol 4-kinase